MIPNGLVAHLFGPIEGRHYYASMLLRESSLLPQLEQLTDYYVIYGDPAYPVRSLIIAPFRGANLTQQRLFKRHMSSVRQSVEWGLRDICVNFAFCDCNKNLKLFFQPVAKYYKVADLLSNYHACLYGNQTSQYFGVYPPTLESYLSNNPAQH